MMKQQDLTATATTDSTPILAIREIGAKARFGGLYYLLGLFGGVIPAPNIHFHSTSFALLFLAFFAPLPLRELAYRFSRKDDDVTQHYALRIIESCYLLNAITWALFTIFLLKSASVLEGSAAATIVACAGVTAGGVMAIIPHVRLINRYCFFMLAIPGVCVPFVITGVERWYVAALYLIYYYYMLRFGRVQSGAYWVARERNIALQKYAAELEIAREQALAGSKAKSEFIAKMSHEIRTPMNGVVGIAQLLENTPLNAQQQKYVHIIRDSGSTLLHIIDDILDVSKLEAEKMSLHREPVDLSQLVADLHELFSLQLGEKPVRLITRDSAELPKWVMADPVRIRQLLYNLIGNAIKFTDRGDIIIELEFISSHDANKGRVKFSITDSGVGIPEQFHPFVFSQFEQFSTQSSAKGTGLGLAISKRLVELMGGDIGFRSAPGVGSRFWFEIPVTVAAEALSPAKTSDPDLQETSVLAGLSVLVVEDDLVNQLVIRSQLEHLGCQVLVIDNGETAIATIRERAFDLIFMDYNLPDMSGLTVTEIIRHWEQEHKKERTPIIALTAHALNEVKQNCIEAGMDDYLTKPVISTELRHIISRWTTQKSISAITAVNRSMPLR